MERYDKYSVLGFLAFFIHIVMSVGINGVIGIFSPVKVKNKDQVPGVVVPLICSMEC